MKEPIVAVTISTPERLRWGDRLAGVMFYLALLFLVALAGLIHRYPHLSRHDLEAELMFGFLGGLWLVFLADAVLRFFQRDRRRSACKALASSLACGLLPPVRMGCRSLTRPDHLWLPLLGWQCCDTHLRRTLERFFSVPMILFALMVLPLFILEFTWARRSAPGRPWPWRWTWVPPSSG